MGFTSLITDSHKSLFSFYGSKLISPSDKTLYDWISKNKTLCSFKTIDDLISNNQAFNILLNSPIAMGHVVCLPNIIFTYIYNSNYAFNSMLASFPAMIAISRSSSIIRSIIANDSNRNALLESTIAMSVIVKSTIAMSIITESQIMMSTIVKSSTMMKYIVESITALNAISESTIAINEIVLSGIALKAIVMNVKAATILENVLQSNVSKILTTLTAARTLFIKSYTSSSLIKNKDNIWYTDSNVFIIPSYFILNHGPVTYASIFYSVLNPNVILGSASCIGTNSKIYYKPSVSLRGSRITFTYSGTYNLAGACFYTMFTAT